MRKITLLILFAFFGCAHAKSKTPPLPPPKTPPPEYVAHDDARDALLAKLALDRAVGELELAKLAWQAAKAKIETKYEIVIERGDGWDLVEDGRLKVRRSLTPPPKK